MVPGRRYTDRREAGAILAEALAGSGLGAGAVALGVARGGVPVAAEVAARLGCDLDLVVVRKLGVPGAEELALGSIASGGVVSINPDVVAAAGSDAEEVKAIAAREGAELVRQERRLRGDRPPVELEGRTAIVIDDGVATGASIRVAIEAARAGAPSQVVVAVPVGPRETINALRSSADLVVCPIVPRAFRAVGAWYERFDQVSDDEVVALLAAH